MITPKGRAFLKRHQISVPQLSRGTGISSTLIQRALSGTRNMSVEKAAAVAAYLGIPIDVAMQDLYHPHLRGAWGKRSAA